MAGTTADERYRRHHRDRALTRPGRPFAGRAVAAVVLLLVMGCGSTVPHDERLAAGSSGADFEAGTAAGQPGPAGELGASSELGAAVSVGSEAVGGSVASPPSDASPGSGDGPQPNGVTGARHLPVAPGTHGVTDTTISIGIMQYDTTQSNAVNLATGGGDVHAGGSLTNREVYDAVFAYMNSQGGLGGREMVPVYVNQNVLDYAVAAGRQQEQQRACEAFTQDHQVFAISGAGATEELMLDCAARTQTPIIANRIQVYPDQERFAAVGDYWFAPHGFTAERRERGLANELLAQGFFGPGARVGLMIEDRPGIRTGVQSMRQVLQDAGVEIAAEFVYPDFLASPWSTYILQLQTRGVTHVLMSATSGASQSTRSMMQAAEDQEWYPRWGIATDNRPKDLVDSGAPLAQLANTQGMGWSPAEDVNVALEPSPASVQCGQIVPEGGAEIRKVACELVFFLRAAFDRMDVISPEAFARAVESLGTSYVSQFTHDGATFFGPSRHDGTEVIRALAFDDRCGQEGAPCFRYVSDPHPMQS